MGIIKQRDNRSGITYAYEVVYRWDKEKQQSRRKSTLRGRIDDETGEIVPTDGRGKRRGTKKKKEAPVDFKHLYEKLQEEYALQEALIRSLKEEIEMLRKGK